MTRSARWPASKGYCERCKEVVYLRLPPWVCALIHEADRSPTMPAAQPECGRCGAKVTVRVRDVPDVQAA